MIKIQSGFSVSKFNHKAYDISNVNKNFMNPPVCDMNKFPDVAFSPTQPFDILNKSFDEIAEIIKVIDELVGN